MVMMTTMAITIVTESDGWWGMKVVLMMLATIMTTRTIQRWLWLYDDGNDECYRFLLLCVFSGILFASTRRLDNRSTHVANNVQSTMVRAMCALHGTMGMWPLHQAMLRAMLAIYVVVQRSTGAGLQYRRNEANLLVGDSEAQIRHSHCDDGWLKSPAMPGCWRRQL